MDLIRGISFEIPNEYERFLGDILKPFDTSVSFKLSQVSSEYL
ncbi:MULTISPECIES: DUF2691 family protein [Paenibacillus]|nr:MULTISPECIES: DUF2691 family protein [Paenibacillus]MCY7488042.1 DUF2691 family protein [Paenibacillus alvei]